MRPQVPSFSYFPPPFRFEAAAVLRLRSYHDPIWFSADNAPASRAVVVASALFSVPFGFRGRFLDLGLSYQASRPYAFVVNSEILGGPANIFTEGNTCLIFFFELTSWVYREIPGSLYMCV